MGWWDSLLEFFAQNPAVSVIMFIIGFISFSIQIVDVIRRRKLEREEREFRAEWTAAGQQQKIMELKHLRKKESEELHKVLIERERASSERESLRELGALDGLIEQQRLLESQLLDLYRRYEQIRNRTTAASAIPSEIRKRWEKIVFPPRIAQQRRNRIQYALFVFTIVYGAIRLVLPQFLGSLLPVFDLIYLLVLAVFLSQLLSVELKMRRGRRKAWSGYLVPVIINNKALLILLTFIQEKRLFKEGKTFPIDPAIVARRAPYLLIHKPSAVADSEIEHAILNAGALEIDVKKDLSSKIEPISNPSLDKLVEKCSTLLTENAKSKEIYTNLEQATSELQLDFISDFYAIAKEGNLRQGFVKGQPLVPIVRTNGERGGRRGSKKRK